MLVVFYIIYKATRLRKVRTLGWEDHSLRSAEGTLRREMRPQSGRDEIRHHADAFEAELRDQPAVSMGVSLL